jgi:hypothetical protein
MGDAHCWNGGPVWGGGNLCGTPANSKEVSTNSEFGSESASVVCNAVCAVEKAWLRKFNFVGVVLYLPEMSFHFSPRIKALA